MTPRATAGFSLVELLVAFTILGLLFALLQDGFLLGHRVWERANLRAATRIEPVEGAQQYLRERISRAYPAWRPVSGPEIDFVGEPQRLAFEAAPPDALRPATRQRHVLSLNGQGELEIAWRPNTDRSLAGAYRRATLVEGVRDLRISYFGPTGFDRVPRWRETWRSQIRPPQAVRIQVAFAPGDPRVWPDLVVAPRMSVDATCIFESTTRACRGRP